MKQEEIFFKGEAPKTIIKYFTNYSGQTSDDDSLYYVIADSNNVPLKLVQSSIETKFGLDPNNYNIPLSSIASGYKVYSGTVVHNEALNQIFTDEDKQFITNNYVQKINFDSTSGSTGVNSNNFSTVFFEDSQYNDYFLNIKLNRSVDVLDTLNIYNVPFNEGTKFTNDTGVLYGKIEAIQVIVDDSGNKLRIPIKNASVGIFNASDEIPSIGSVDQDGNRIRMNLFDNIKSNNILQSYGSFQSFLTDVKYSPKDYQNDTIPSKYKYTSLTNENGEFVLHGVPVGQQTLMVEIDLLKQGLEPEEVALNFFPYSTLDDPNVSNIPHLYFNQFPVNIVPSWGEIQTGYTQIDLAIVLDLRKWITYFTFPISSKIGNPTNISNQATDSTPLILEELRAKGITNPFTVFVRDMTKPFDITNPAKTELVKIIDIYDKNLDFKCAWNEEFKTKGNKIEYFNSNFNAFKLPANLYDPNGTDTNGRKGVWLGAYQIKTAFPDPNSSYQVTGYGEEWPTDFQGNSKYYKASHYDLNRYENWNREDNQPLPGSGIGKFPYEKPWSLTYPEPYIVTKKPSIPNPLKNFTPDNQPILNVNITNRNGVINNYQLTSGQFFTEPRFLDGDLVGGSDAWGTNANGYGLQTFQGTWAGNNFSREVTKNEIWRYESTQNWADEWSNGYVPGLTPYGDFDKYPDSRDGKPDVYGERWQRIEAGFAYWLRPRGWPRIRSENWGDHLLENDYDPLANHDNNSVFQNPIEYKSYYNSIYNYLDEITLEMGARAGFFSQFGGLSIYRIEKPYYCNPKKPPFTDKYAKFHIQEIIIDQSKNINDYGGDDQKRKKVCYSSNSVYGGSKCTNSGPGDIANAFIWLEKGGKSGDSEEWNDFIQECNTQFCTLDELGGSINIRILNIGTTKVNINGKELVPGDYSKGIDISITRNAIITLPANDKYDPNNNSYEGASYLFYMGALTTSLGYYRGGGIVQPVYKYKVGIEGSEVNYYLTSMIPRQVGLGGSKCNAVKDYNSPAGFSIQGIGGLLNLAIAAYLIYFGPISLVLTYVVLPKNIKNQIFDALRNICSSDAYNYNSDWRQANNLGVFINGYGFYIPVFRYLDAYINSRLKNNQYLLPYIGEETAEAAKLNINNVPYQGSWWYTDYRTQTNAGTNIMAFQPKPISPNNLKGTGNMPYYMEFIGDVNGTTVYTDYSKGF